MAPMEQDGDAAPGDMCGIPAEHLREQSVLVRAHTGVTAAKGLPALL